jgi:adenosyl cobinamide kinase/adenosyl cobinamide phosphate guanylyltransferase
MIIEGLDRLIIATVERDHPRAYWQEMFSRWEQWVLQDKNRQLIVIGSDISKGIVPTDPHQRNGRDLVGFCYQDLVKKCKRVDLVWYGINQTLKED